MKLCPKCNTEHNKPGIFCSRSCANSRGPRSDFFKKTVSKKLTGRKHSADWYEQNSGDNHWRRKGKNLPPLENECVMCGNIFKAYRSKNQNTTFYCSKECWLQSNEMQRSAWENYVNKCKFNFNVYNYPEWFDINLIETHGWYKAKNKGNNLNGVSRDHRISVKEGFINNIDPIILSHPANCELKLHKDNQKKRTKSSITLETLKEDIIKFNSKYNYDPMAE